MSNSDILLTVSAADESSEVLVIDDHFHVLGRGIHSIDLYVPPGIYRAKARVGNKQMEKLFSVESSEPGNHKFVQLDGIDFPTPIPLDRTTTTHEYHQQALYEMTGGQFPAANLGAGAALVIFLRDTSNVCFNLDAASLESYAQNFRGFVLSDWDGLNGHALEDLGRFDAGRGYFILNASVNPGAYALSRPSDDTERIYLPLIVPAGWALQVFVAMEQTGDNTLLRRANFDNAAMALDRPNTVFSPLRPDLRVLEVARHALARGHNFIGERAMEELLAGKFENPMMGIFSAHLLLLDKKPNLSFVETVIANTAMLIGAEYPDLLALSWKLNYLKYGRTKEDRAAFDASSLLERLKHPPLLQLSWHYLMEAYRSAPGEATFDAELRKLSNRLISSSVWLCWISYPAPVPESLSDDTELDTSQETEQIDASAIRDVAQYALRKAKAWLAPATMPSDTFSSGRTKSLLEDVITHAKAEGNRKGESVVGDTLTGELFQLLVKNVDWGALVKFLKVRNVERESPNMLSPLQRRLILSLKSAQEQLEDDGKISEESLARWLTASDIPGQALVDNLNFLGRFAKSIADVESNRTLPP